MPDTLTTQAIGALESALISLLPGAVPPSLTRSLRVSPRRVAPMGLGGFVGTHVEPGSALFGRRLVARVDVDVSGGADAAAASYVSSLSGQMLAFTRAEFATRGIRRLQGVDSTSTRAIAFDVDFEFVPTPVASEGVITTLALETFNNLTPYRTRLVADFAGDTLASIEPPADRLADFLRVDDPSSAPAGNWAVDVDAIAQTSSAVGGALTLADPVKAGTVLLWRPDGAALTMDRLVASVVFASPGSDGIGLVFGHTAPDDYLFVLASQRHSYHLLGRRTPAGWQTLASAPFGYAIGSAHRLALTVFDGTVALEIDERRTLTVDGVPSIAGEIGLMTHGNSTARFAAGRVMALE